MTSLLEIENLSVDLRLRGGDLRVVNRIGLDISASETVCLVGESGSGKTVTALSITRLIDFKGGHIATGEVRLAGRNLVPLSQRAMSDLRGLRIGFVFQEPMTAFDPMFSIGAQIGETIIRHRGVSQAAARREAIELLRRVHIPDPHLRVDQHPHQLSGGMRQRAMIAMALACGPDLLIADEPTTALDVTIQAQILKLLQELQAESGMAILLITHNLGIAAEIADRVVVMYAGRIVEDAAVGSLFARPAHPYTRGLLRSVVGPDLPRGERLYSIRGTIPHPAEAPSGCLFHPRCPRASHRCVSQAPELVSQDGGLVACWHPHTDFLPPPQPPAEAAPTAAPAERRRLIELVELRKHFSLGFSWRPGQRPVVRAVDGVSLDIREGETFGLVGESGCGKSTLARVVLQLERATSGAVLFDGEDLTRLNRSRLRRVRRHMQMVFQDPYGSIDPRWTVERIIGEPLEVHETLSAAQRRERIRTLLDQVGLDARLFDRYPHQLSGGQRQRVAIARAIAVHPRFVLADEAVSALDVSVQAQVINLLQDLKDRLGLTYLFIGHDLNLVRHVSDRIGVMYLGRLVERGPADAVFHRPAHPYTQALIAAIPEPDPALRRAFAAIAGEIPSPTRPPGGCRFHPRCPAATSRCREEEPAPVALDADRMVACHFPL